MLNNQPMGFYHSSTIIKDGQRHGLRIKPIDITQSNWLCTLEEEQGEKCLRLGLCYAKGLREEAARALLEERARFPIQGIDDLALRVPELRKNELTLLAEIGALNFIPSKVSEKRHRRDALWETERASRPTGPLFKELPESNGRSPLARMTDDERMAADFRGTGLTIGHHPLAYRRNELNRMGVLRALDLKRIPDGQPVRVAGCVIVRQRPGTAKGFVFLSLEDETGISNIIVTPDIFDHNRAALVNEPFLLIQGVLQNQENVVSVKARSIERLPLPPATVSHDFH